MSTFRDHRTTADLTRQLDLVCTDSEGNRRRLATTFSYERRDPYAVTIAFPTATGVLPWTFSRDLLVYGLTEPVGDGDVHVWPCVNRSGQDVVVIELSSPDGHLVAQGTTDAVHAFVARTLELVPAGAETAQLDLDALVDQLLAG